MAKGIYKANAFNKRVGRAGKPYGSCVLKCVAVSKKKTIIRKRKKPVKQQKQAAKTRRRPSPSPPSSSPSQYVDRRTWISKGAPVYWGAQHPPKPPTKRKERKRLYEHGPILVGPHQKKSVYAQLKEDGWKLHRTEPQGAFFRKYGTASEMKNTVAKLVQEGK